jgi:hypothetical protein
LRTPQSREKSDASASVLSASVIGLLISDAWMAKRYCKR